MAQLSILALGSAASLLLAQAAHAQTGACDQLKATLAARIDPGIRGYALEAVPAGAPVPPGAKVIGNCEGGAWKILFFRSGGAQPSLETANAVGSAAAPRASAAPVEAKRQLVQAPSDLASQPVATSAPLAKPQRGSPAIGAAASLPKRSAEAHESGASASGGGVAQVVDRAADPSAQAQRDQAPTASASIAQQASEFGGRHWPWLAALGFLMLGASLWAWLAHHSAYDAAGLPRGPKIN